MEVSVRLLKTLIPTHAKLQLYKAAILSHLTYCSTGRGGGGGAFKGSLIERCRRGLHGPDPV